MMQKLLPVLLYVLPLCVLMTAPLPAKWKPFLLAVGGVCTAYFTGGFAAMALLMGSVCGTWLLLWLMPADNARCRTRRLLLYGGVVMQFVLLLTGRLLGLRDTLLPLLFCAMTGIEHLNLRAHDNLQAPSLFSFFCRTCAIPKLLAGPVLSPAQMQRMTRSRTVTAERIGLGARYCICGLVQFTLLSLPMQTLVTELDSYVTVRTAADAWLSLIVLFCAYYYGLRGAVNLGDGIALMLGYRHPPSFAASPIADSFCDFWAHSLSSCRAWVLRMFEPASDLLGVFLSRTVLLGVVGGLFGQSIGGVFWGVWQAAFLTLERLPAVQQRLKTFPRFLRRLLTAALFLLTLIPLHAGSFAAQITMAEAVCGVNGVALSDTAAYFCRTHWIPLLLCLALLFPIYPALRKRLRKHPTVKRAAGLCLPLAELCLLLACMAELLSRYLRG